MLAGQKWAQSNSPLKMPLLIEGTMKQSWLVQCCWTCHLDRMDFTWFVEKEVGIQSDKDDWLFDAVCNNSVDNLYDCGIFLCSWAWFSCKYSDGHDNDGMNKQVKTDFCKQRPQQTPSSCFGRQLQILQIEKEYLVEAVAGVGLFDDVDCSWVGE